MEGLKMLLLWLIKSTRKAGMTTFYTDIRKPRTCMDSSLTGNHAAKPFDEVDLFT